MGSLPEFTAFRCRPGATLRSPETERVFNFQSWKDFVHDNFPWLEHKDHCHGDFEAEVSAFKVGIGSLTTICAGASEVIRTRHLAEASEAGFIKLMWQMSGHLCIEQSGNSSVIEAGQATVCDTARPYRIRLSHGAHFVVFMLPYASCPGWEHISQRVCGTRLRDCPAIHAALGALMGAVGNPQDSVSTTESDTVVQAVQWMVSACLHRSAGDCAFAGFRNARLGKAVKHIVDNIGDPQLDANRLASALCMSRRSLYLLFKEHNLTPARLINETRLERSMCLLGNPNARHRKITDIAFDNGFSDYATFSRLFKARYGVTPTEYRTGSNPALQ